MKLRVGGWFRHYSETLLDPKIQRLTDRQHRVLMGLWALTNMHDGVLPPLPDIAFHLRIAEDEAFDIVTHLTETGLLEADDHGAVRPHNWAARQQSESADRTRRYRERKKRHCDDGSDGGGDARVTPGDGAVTGAKRGGDGQDLRLKTEESDPPFPPKGGVGGRPAAGDFEKFWEAYPQRLGGNPREAAEREFDLAVWNGATVAQLIHGAIAYARDMRKADKVGTRWVAQAATWIANRRWRDYGDPPPFDWWDRCPRGIPEHAWRRYGPHWTEATPDSLPPERWESWKTEHLNGGHQN